MDENDPSSDLAVTKAIADMEGSLDGEPDSQIVVLSEARGSIFTGPLPHPDILKAYDEVVPGSAKEMFAEAMENSRAERIMNEETFAALRENSHKDRLFGFVLGVLILVVGLAFMFMGHPNPGAAIILGTLVAVLAIFITGRKQTDRDGLAQPDDDCAH